jgi:hypothetical protein
MCLCFLGYIQFSKQLQLRQLKNVLRPDSDLAFKRPRLASSGHESASFANDGDDATSWTSDVHDTEAFWQVRGLTIAPSLKCSRESISGVNDWKLLVPGEWRFASLFELRWLFSPAAGQQFHNGASLWHVFSRP